MTLRRRRLVTLVAAVFLGVLAAAGPAQSAIVFKRAFGHFGGGAGRLDDPIRSATDAVGHVYVTDAHNNRVDEFSKKGRFVRAWGWGVTTGANTFQICTTHCLAGIAGAGDGEFSFPYGIAIARGHIYVSDAQNNRIERFSVSTAAFERKWGTFGHAQGQLNNPLGVDILPGGRLYVVDNGNSRMQEFTANGTFVRMWGWGVTDGTPAFQVCTAACQTGISGSGPGQFASPASIAVTATGRAYVVDTGNQRVERFTATPAFVGQFGTGRLDNPKGIDLDATGHVYVADTGHNQIDRFTSAGRFLLKWGGAMLDAAEGVTIAPHRRIYVVDTNHNRVVVYLRS